MALVVISVMRVIHASPPRRASDNAKDHRDFEGGRRCDAIPMFDRPLSSPTDGRWRKNPGSCACHFMSDSDPMHSVRRMVLGRRRKFASIRNDQNAFAGSYLVPEGRGRTDARRSIGKSSHFGLGGPVNTHFRTRFKILASGERNDEVVVQTGP